MSEHPFYGQHIIRDSEQRYIEKLLEKYKKMPVSDELKEKIWNELQMEKYKGNITIPFKLVINRDPTGKFPDLIEVILETKV